MYEEDEFGNVIIKEGTIYEWLFGALEIVGVMTMFIVTAVFMS